MAGLSSARHGRHWHKVELKVSPTIQLSAVNVQGGLGVYTGISRASSISQFPSEESLKPKLQSQGHEFGNWRPTPVEVAFSGMSHVWHPRYRVCLEQGV